MTFLLNLAAYSTQLLLLIAIGLALPTVLRITAPAVRHAYWRGLLLICLLLPWVQGRREIELAGTTVMVMLGTPDVATGLARLPLEPWDWVAFAITLLLTGVAVRLAWVMLGLVRLRRLRASGEIAQSNVEHTDAQRHLETVAEIRYVSDLAQPVTFGLRRPVILLPDDLRTAAAGIERAVIYHELLHVQRRDWSWLLLEEIVRAIFWFHPAIWLLVSRIQQSREEAIDELAVMATGSRRVYIEALARFAGAGGATPAPAFAQRQMLFRRILLLSRSRSMSSQRVTVTGAVVLAILLAGSWTAIRAFPLMQDADFGEAAQSLVSRVDVVLPRWPVGAEPRSPVTPATPVATTAEPRRRATSIGAAPRDADAPAPRSIAVTEASLASNEPTPAPAPLALPPPVVAPLRVGSAISAPKRTKHVAPIYPPIAQTARVSGLVIIEATIDAEGRVAAAHVMRSIPLLDQAALEAVRQWEFTPTLLNGAPVPIVMSLVVNFQLER